MDAITLTLLLAGSVPIAAVSWRALRHPGSHGFYRFFAFEAIVCIVALNARVWFRDPLGPWQLASWFLLTVSLVLAVQGFHLLQQRGQPRAPAAGSPMFPIENTAALVTTGAYRLVRHPLYASLLYLAWGAAFKSLTPVTLLSAAVATLALWATAKSEEAENIRRFGQSYREYMARTRRFIPFLL